ncbi:putative zinc-binding metallopeptidase [Galbibacter sp. PAP.153]|uniref:zinc-binding metallopeptidase n=1 Tax=Galbibacter sp. PAP.153 TaxID=3104623 RepID=UPI00300B3833
MKFKYSITVTLVLMLLWGCDSEKSLGESRLDTETPPLTALDIWIREQYINPYNIDVLYKWNDNEIDNGRYLYPPTLENIQPLMEVVKYIWIDSYNELGGGDFIKKIAPRQYVLVGGYNVNPGGTITLGIADSGMKITLFNVDYLDLDDRETMREFFHTIQHEYCHILNQTRPFSPDYDKVTPSGYIGNWTDYNDFEAREEGFISAYSRANSFEDFAEMTSALLTYSAEEYQDILDSIESEESVRLIKQKEAIVADYYLKEWDIDIYELQALNYQKLVELTN